MLLKSASQYLNPTKTCQKLSSGRCPSSSLRSSQGVKKKKPKKSHNRASSTGFELTPLEGPQVLKAPKLYQNQIFSDIFDEKGNHDRIVEFSQDNIDYQEQYLLPELLLLPSVGRNSHKVRKIVFN